MKKIGLLKKNKAIVILGPTASGKSDVAIKLAKKFNGEIISADSRQIYKGMDIGSGKIPRDFSEKNQKSKIKNQNDNEIYISDGIAHHLIDVVNPNDDFNISHFKKLAEKSIADILKREKIPIICGGTGFWIRSVVDNIQLPDVKPDQLLRSMLRNKPAGELFEMLKKLDPERAENIDAKNKVRLIRAIEICKSIGSVPKLQNKQCHPELVCPVAYATGVSVSDLKRAEMLKQVQHDNPCEFLQIGIDVSREILNEKIKKRLDQRFKQGMLEEVENLHNPPAGGGVSWERLEYFGLEYRWIARYLQKKILLGDMKERLYFDIIHYAKRQMTWFGRDKRILWLKDYEGMEKVVRKFLF